MFARYRISFNINLYLGIKEDLEISLEPYERAKLFLHPSSGIPNTGEIVVEVAEPNETLARNYAEEILQEFLFFLSIEENTTVGRLNTGKIDFENREDFNKGVVETRSFTRRSDVTFVHSLDQTKLDNFGEKLSKIHALDQPERELLLKFLRVYNSGKKGRYPSDELIYRWVALEVIVSNPSNPQKALRSINDFIFQRFPVDRARNIIQKHSETINELIKADLHNYENTKNRSELLKEELQKSKPQMKEVLNHALGCIYEIRNGVIHRSKEYAFLHMVNNMLDYILKDFWDFRSPT